MNDDFQYLALDDSYEYQIDFIFPSILYGIVSLFALINYLTSLIVKRSTMITTATRTTTRV